MVLRRMLAPNRLINEPTLPRFLSVARRWAHARPPSGSPNPRRFWWVCNLVPDRSSPRRSYIHHVAPHQKHRLPELSSSTTVGVHASQRGNSIATLETLLQSEAHVFRFLLAAAFLPTVLSAQHPEHPGPQQTPMKLMAMMMIDPLGVPMERMGSGTTWIPDAVSLPARHKMVGPWLVMLHGFGFLQYDKQGGPRGDEQFGSLNWAMLMASRDLWGGRFQARTMVSLDPATVSLSGYPLLLQTGESYRGQPLVDRQHPHDFWMELAVMYERALSHSIGVTAYAAPSGEPALGPVAFMHRPSAMDNLAAPLGHHWQDATHISFGVLTVGVFGPRWKLEGSAFNGREPDEERWGFDPIRLDSYSGRLTVNPDSSWSFSAGYGYLKSPEVSKPGESTHRVTASLLHARRLGMQGQLATALIWGVNRHSGKTTHSALAEAEAILNRGNTVFARVELVQKNAEELVLATGPGGFAPDSTFNVAALSVGYIREVGRTSWATLGVGFQGSLNVVPRALDPIYGSRTPVGGMLFLRIRPLHAPHDLSTTMAPMPGMREHTSP